VRVSARDTIAMAAQGIRANSFISGVWSACLSFLLPDTHMFPDGTRLSTAHCAGFPSASCSWHGAARCAPHCRLGVHHAFLFALFYFRNKQVRCFVHPKLGSDDCVVNAVQWATYCFLVGVDPTDTKALKSPRTLPPIDSLNMCVRSLMDVSQCACLLL
jgi:hypothetical protein